MSKILSDVFATCAQSAVVLTCVDNMPLYFTLYSICVVFSEMGDALWTIRKYLHVFWFSCKYVCLACFALFARFTTGALTLLEYFQDGERILEGSPVRPEDLARSFINFSCFRAVWKHKMIHIFINVKLNGPATNPELISLDGMSTKKLLDFQVNSRPLVLNFGSCS